MNVRVTAPKLLLVVLALVTATPALLMSLLTMRNARYPEPNVVNAHLGEVMALVLPVVCIAVAVAASTFLRADVVWYARSSVRGARLLLCDATAVALAAGGGVGVGLSPLLVWAEATATSGPSAFPYWAVSVLGAVASALLVLGVMTRLRTAWVGVAFAVVWIALFYRGKLMGDGGTVPSTRFTFLPFVGTNVPLAAETAINPSVVVTRLLASLVLGFFGLALIWSSRASAARPRTGPSVAAVAAVLAIATLAGLSLRSVPVAVPTAPELACEGAAPRVCLYASHQRDAPVVRDVAQRISVAAGPELLRLRTVREGDAAASEPGTVNVDLTANRLNSPVDDAATGIALGVVDFDTCLRLKRGPEQTIAAETVARWFSAIGSGDPARSIEGGGPHVATLRSWLRNPEQTNARLRQHAAQIRSCTLDLDDVR